MSEENNTMAEEREEQTKGTTAEQGEAPAQQEDTTRAAREEALRKIREKNEIERAQIIRASEIMKEGKGRLRLEKPIRAGGTDIEELVYDFTVLSGEEYIDAMDSDMNSNNAFRITYKQALTLFAIAAAKQTPMVDAQDIMERIGMTDAVQGEQLARLFFNASTRAGQMRISKK